MGLKNRLNLLLGISLLLVAAPAMVQSQSSVDTDQAAREIFGETMSPYCPGRLLNDCPSGAAYELKTKIREKLQAGESKQEVFDYLLSVYGEQVRAAPLNQGFGRAAWLATPIFVILGLYLISILLRRSRTVERASKGAPLDPKMQKRIQAELEKL